MLCAEPTQRITAACGRERADANLVFIGGKILGGTLGKFELRGPEQSDGRGNIGISLSRVS